jgi:hypothetical protein
MVETVPEVVEQQLIQNDLRTRLGNFVLQFKDLFMQEAK